MIRSGCPLAALVCCLVAAVALGAPSSASAHACGRADGVKFQAYNLSCRKARSIFGGQPPKGWTAGNVDVAGGLVFYCHAVDQETVTKAIDRRTGRVRARRLHGAPLIIAAEPYGEDRRLDGRRSSSRQLQDRLPNHEEDRLYPGDGQSASSSPGSRVRMRLASPTALVTPPPRPGTKSA